MAHGKTQFCTWRCTNCNMPKSVTGYNKKRNEEIVKEKNLHCERCRKHFPHKRKDTKKGS